MFISHRTIMYWRTILLACVLFGFFSVAAAAQAATLSLSPATGVYTVGQTFTARVLVNTAGQKINAAEGTLSYKPSELTVLGVSKGSVFNLWTAEPAFSNAAGTVTFSGGTPTGYTGSGGTVISVTFKVLTAGSPRVSFSSGSVLAADGRGTNVLSGMTGGSYTTSAPSATPEPETIIEYVPPANTPGAPQISSDTHPDPAAWYATTDATLSWTVPAGVTALRTLLDDRSTSIPTKVYDTPINSIELTDLDQGVQYFHLQFKNEDGWGKVTHYRLAVDSEAPADFTLAIPEGADLSNPEQVLVPGFAEDAGSPINRFMLQIDGAAPVEVLRETATGTIPLPTLEPGYHTVVAEAFDSAGNSAMASLSFTILSFDKPVFTNAPERISAGVIPVFEGATRPGAEVEIAFTRVGAEPVTYKTTSDENGVFRFIPDRAMTVGVYDIVARATDQYGALSEPSDTLRVVVETPGYLQIGSLVVSVLSVLVPLVALTLLLVLLMLFGYRRVRTMRSGVVREAREAIAIIDREFGVLASTLSTRMDTLSEKRKSGKLTKAEASLYEDMAAALGAARRRIVDEVTDVEEVVE